MIAVLFFVIFYGVKSEKGCCKFKPVGESGMIDLTPFAGQFFTFPLPGYVNHQITTTFCDVLDSQHICEYPTTTYGPTPFKDEYRSSDGVPNNSCYYIGGLDNCTFGAWEPHSKTSILHYPGVPDQENQIRDVKWTVHCDSTAKDTTANCRTVTSSGNRHVYECDVLSKYGCPGAHPPPTELGCSICKVFISNLRYGAMHDEKSYVDHIKQFYCPTRKDPKECYDSVEGEITTILDEMGEKGEAFCKDLKFCS